MKKIYAIVKHPGEQLGHIMEIENTLDSLQKAVGGHIETVAMANKWSVICDVEGLLKGKPYNCDVYGVEFVGTILVVGVEGEELVDVPIDLNDWKDVIG